MGSPVPDDSSQKAAEIELFDIGKRLLRRPSSTDNELLILLEKAERLLAKVWQQPQRSTCRALLPVMKALIKDELLHHDDVNIQVALASCFNELTRITAPDFTYGDDKMRIIFQLFIVAFEHLSCESGRNYYKALQIVETMAKVRSSLMLLDIDKDGLVVEMFELFLKNIGSNHPSDLFKYKEMIMTLVIEESDEISFELLRPLLASVKMNNKDTNPITWELGIKVFENSVTKLQCYLTEAVQAMNLELGDYAEIVASILHDTSKEKNVSEEVAPTASDGHCNTVLENGASKSIDVTELNLDDRIPTESLKGSHRIKQSGMCGAALRKRRGRKPNSVMRTEEGNECTWKRGGRCSNEASLDSYEEREGTSLPSDLGNSSMLSKSSQKKVDSLNDASRKKKVQSKKKESMINLQNELEISSTLKKRKILKSKERDYDTQKKGKKAISGASDIRMEKEEEILGDGNKEVKHELRQEPNRGTKIISPKNEQEDDADKMEDFPMLKPAKAKSQRKEKKSRRSWSTNGMKLVNLRIQVWWPKDKMFYPGIVKAFDPETKKHTILYDDDEVEILNLRKQTWERISDEQSPEVKTFNQGGCSSPHREPTKMKEKNLKRKAST